MAHTSRIIVYTDGSSRGNPGPGGYGVVLLWGEKAKKLSEGFRKTTNNRMELLAVIKALEAINKPSYPVLIHSDSKYVIDAITKGWLQGWVKKGFKGKKNPDLWRRYLKVAEPFSDLQFQWVKGHAGNVYNEMVDEMAVEAALGQNLKVDQGYEEST